MAISEQELNELAQLIVANIKEDFAKASLSRNLVNTIKITSSNNQVKIEIPAEIYDIPLFREKGVVRYTGKGSYAEKVNEDGGFSGLHKQYVERAINKALQVWTNKQRNKYSSIERRDNKNG